MFCGVSTHVHYNDVIISAMASQITSVTFVYSRRRSKKTSKLPASLAFVRGLHRWAVNSPHKESVTRKIFPFDDVFMQFNPQPSLLLHWNWKGMRCWQALLGHITWCPAFKSNYSNLFKDRPHIHFIYGSPISKWVEESWPQYPGQQNGNPLRWRHNGHDAVSNHQPHDCLLNRLFRHRSKQTSKLRVTLCGEFTGGRWIPRTNGQSRGKCFHLMTSSC